MSMATQDTAKWDCIDVRDVRLAVRDVYDAAGDYEAAHGMEDRLRRNLLRAIAEGRCVDPEECARLALVTDSIDFPRHMA